MTQSANINEHFAYMTATLLTDNVPSLWSLLVSFPKTEEIKASYKSYADALAKSTPNKTFLHYRDTLNPAAQAGTGISFEGKQQTISRLPAMVFPLPGETHQINPNDKKNITHILQWTVNNILSYTNPSDMKEPDAYVRELIFPLADPDNNIDNTFFVVITGNVDVKTLTRAPDIIHTFSNFNDFNMFINIQVNNIGARIQMLNIEGDFTKDSLSFTAKKSAKVILLSTVAKQQIEFLILSYLDQFNNKLDDIKKSLVTVSFLKQLKNALIK